MLSIFKFTTSLPSIYKNDLEQLFFFNPQQQRYYNQIVNMVEAFGQPYINLGNEEVQLKMDGHPELTNLFALHGERLVGVALFDQFVSKTLSVLHIALDSDYTVHGNYKKQQLMDAYLQEFLRIAKASHTIEKISIGYSKRAGRLLAIPVV